MRTASKPCTVQSVEYVMVQYPWMGVTLKDKKEDVFHSECLTCVKCSDPLDGKFFTLDRDIICEKCIAKEVKTGNIYQIFVKN